MIKNPPAMREDPGLRKSPGEGNSYPLQYSGLENSMVCIVHVVATCHTHNWAAFTCTFSSVAQSCLTLCNPKDCSTPGFPVHYQLWELTEIHVHQVGDAIQPTHPLSSPSPTFNLSQHQGLFQWASSSNQVAKVLEFQLQHQSFQWISGLISFRIDWFDLPEIQGTLKSLL